MRYRVSYPSDSLINYTSTFSEKHRFEMNVGNLPANRWADLPIPRASKWWSAVMHVQLIAHYLHAL